MVTENEAFRPLRYSFTCAVVHFVALDRARINEKGELQTGVPDAAIDWLRSTSPRSNRARARSCSRTTTFATATVRSETRW